MSLQTSYSLASDEIAACLSFALRVAETYTTPSKAASLANTVDNTTHEKRERAWLCSRTAEFAFARMIGCDPLNALDWGTSVDKGYDLEWRGWFFDVKASEHRSPRLIWPLTRAGVLQEANTDFLVLCSVDLSAWGATVTCHGVVSLPRFISAARNSKGTDGLLRGTRWMPATELTPLSEFAFIKPR